MATHDLKGLLGQRGAAIERQRAAALQFLEATPRSELLERTGQIIAELPKAEHFTKGLFQDSYVINEHDLLVGKGLFFLDEENRLYLDCTAGHYQMTWGYNHPVLADAVRECLDKGIVWDCHSNIPGDLVKRLADTLIALCNKDIASLDDVALKLADAPDRLNRVNLGTATGTAACSTAIKIALKYYEDTYMDLGPPVIITHAGNYHGTDIFTQRMRGMWAPYFAGANVEFALVEPNDTEQLREVFARCGKRCALFMTEPVMMNREAILIESNTMKLIRQLCDETDALMAIDEIQTAFWRPDVFMFKEYGIVPDAVITGKGMTCGFHPLSATIFKSRFDNLKQYDSLSTNGGAPIAACVALHNVALIEQQRDRIRRTSQSYHDALTRLAGRFPDAIAAVHGSGYLCGLKFRSREVALAAHKACVQQGLWLRVHAYHEGHSTILTKFCLLVDEEIIEFAVAKLARILRDVTT